MIDPDRLTELILNCDFTYAELENICGGFLGLSGEPLENVLGNGVGSWQHRIIDLVAWADRQGSLSELTQGVLHYGGNKRAVREWIVNGEKMTQANVQNDQSNALFRLEIKVDRVLERQDTIIAEHGDLKHRVASVETITHALQQHQSPTIDRIMVTMLALSMLAMLAFNAITVLR
jgi:hypothetical protein